MFKIIDNAINSTTMYRLVLYGLFFIAFFSITAGFLGLLPYSARSLAFSLSLLLITCYLTNLIFSKLFQAPANPESWTITALILFFLFMPAASTADMYVPILAGIIAMASKYLLAINKNHIFNPAAISAFILSFNPTTVTIWWIGSPVLFPLVLILGLVIVRKIRKFRMFLTFLASSIVSLSLYGYLKGILSVEFFTGMLVSGPVIFLGTIMLTEPLTTPSSQKKQTLYGLLVGVLAGFPFSIGPLYSTPEMALVIGNLFSFLISPRQRLKLKLVSKNMLSGDIYEFMFINPRKISFKPGQYMEWTLPHKRTDTRGIRRFFSLASSPTEKEMLLTIKTSENSSTFKKKLLTLVPGDTIIASQITGDFVLPEDTGKKLVFLAGGIGITPFRSMIKYLIDTKEQRSVTLFYINRTANEFIYNELFNKASREFGLKTNYVITEKDHVPSNWSGLTGRIDRQTIEDAVPDWQISLFYISGPNAMVNNYKRMLLSLGVKRVNIITDYFPGY